MGIKNNWESFVKMTKARAESHHRLAQYWNKLHLALSLTLMILATLTTVATLLPVSNYYATGLGIASSLVSAINSALHPSQLRQREMEASKSFRTLMLRMVRVETEREYEELWKTFNHELLNEPFLPQSFQEQEHVHLGMTPEFQLIVQCKVNLVLENGGDIDGGMCNLHDSDGEEDEIFEHSTVVKYGTLP